MFVIVLKTVNVEADTVTNRVSVTFEVTGLPLTVSTFVAVAVH